MLRWCFLLVAALCIVVGCKKDPPAPTPDPTNLAKVTPSAGDAAPPPPDAAARSHSGLAWPTIGDPGCKSHADCAIVVSGPGGDDPCCDVTVSWRSYSVGYLQAVAAWRQQSCPKDLRCPPGALPGALPSDCGRAPRCDQGVCKSAAALGETDCSTGGDPL